jgi:antitoxin (DNA-binding transcriptional repressor) of toxin-antitoxin stability system
MSEYGVYEAKTKLAELIKEVERGGTVTITNRGVPMVDLVLTKATVEHRTRDAILAIKRLRSTKIDTASFNELRLQGRK